MKKAETNREFQNERQPYLALTDVLVEVNRKDAAREQRKPEQLDLLPKAQLDLFS